MPILERSRLRASRALEATLAALRPKHVLTYFVGAGRLRLIEVVEGEPRITSVSVDLQELERLVDDFIARPEDNKAAAALGRALVPADVLPTRSARIYIVPTTPLQRVPFAALRVSGERLLDRFEIAYAPTVTSLAGMMTDKDRATGPGMVVIDTRSDLLDIAKEFRAVVDETGASARVGADSTVAALRGARDASLLHVFSNGGVISNHIQLNDGLVTAADVVAWRIHPRVVVLHASVGAATSRSESWSSLAVAFVAAGSGHVVTSLTSVEDSAAAEFARLFYRSGGLRDPVGAVNRAQRAMMWHYPVEAWSAFVAIGP